MSGNYGYDVAVIGSGPGGYVAAIRAAQLGAKACVVERDELGGVCTNVGCIPTKVLWHSARMLTWLGRAGEFGLHVGEVRGDYAAVAARRDKVVQTLRSGVASLLKANGVEAVAGAASFRDEHTLRVEGEEAREITAAKVFIATGSVPTELPHIPFDHKRVIDSTDAVTAGELPRSIMIIGGGYVGCEFASIYAPFGVEVTVVEMLASLIPTMDADCARELARSLKKLGVKVHTGTKVEEVSAAGGGVTARLSGGETVRADQCLVCVGRRPDSAGLALEKAGLSADGHGAIPVNDHMQTARPHVYAVGDVTGRAMLAHMASHEGLVAAAHATGKESARMDWRLVPGCVFASTEVAAVGLTEEEARRQGGEVTVKKFPFRALGKAHILGETEGFVKIVAAADSREVLGVHIAGPEASVMLGEACLAMDLECTAEELAETIHVHPTLAEALKEAAEGVVGAPINWKG